MTRAATNAAFTAPSWTTANRPASPTVGQIGWNITLNQIESWNGSAWQRM
jgi:hypothetical protein